MDLKSEKLHEILTLSDNFEIKFELKDKKDVHGGTVQEKSGYVKLLHIFLFVLYYKGYW